MSTVCVNSLWGIFTGIPNSWLPHIKEYDPKDGWCFEFDNWRIWYSEVNSTFAFLKIEHKPNNTWLQIGKITCRHEDIEYHFDKMKEEYNDYRRKVKIR